MLCLFLLLSPYQISAEEDVYLIADVSAGYKQVIKEFKKYKEAYSYFQKNKSRYDDLVLYKGDEVVMMEYGIVEFKTEKGCRLDVSYHSTLNNRDVLINGCYGIDALYLNTSSDGNKVYFQISSDQGYAMREDVILHPYELYTSRLSRYRFSSGSLYHDIKTETQSPYYAISVLLDRDVYFLRDGSYLSYDGQYFYDNFYLLSDDVKQGSHDHALNAEAYYPYFLYLPLHSSSNYNLEEFDKYLEEYLGIKGPLYTYEDNNLDQADDRMDRSQLYDIGNALIYAWQHYGINALELLSIAIQDSSYGKNEQAFSMNSLFLHSAFDSDKERENRRYDSIEDCLISVAEYLFSGSYSNIHSRHYTGLFPGNKASGLNVYYSSDPYWGEKIASFCMKIDEDMGKKDYKAHPLVFLQEDTALYSDSRLKQKAYQSPAFSSFAVISQDEDSYKVFSDLIHDSDHHYDLEKDALYLSKQKTIVLNDQKEEEKEMLRIDVLDGEEIIDSFKIRQGEIPAILPKEKEGYLYIGTEPQIAAVQEDTSYQLVYEAIESVDFDHEAISVNRFGYPDLSGLSFTVTMENGTIKEIPLDSSHLTSFDLTNQKAEVSFGENIFPVSLILPDREDYSEQIEKAMTSYLNDGTVEEDIIKEISANAWIKEDFETIRLLDQMCLQVENGRVEYVFDEARDVSISGLGLSFEKEFHDIFKDILYVDIKDAKAKDAVILQRYGRGYGYQTDACFSISFRYNMKAIEPVGPLVVSLQMTDPQNRSQFAVYCLKDNGEVVKCRSAQSDGYIRFICETGGSFVILEKTVGNLYDIPDVYENKGAYDNGIDHHFYRLLILSLILLLLVLSTSYLSYDIYGKSRIRYGKTAKSHQRKWALFKKKS